MIGQIGQVGMKYVNLTVDDKKVIMEFTEDHAELHPSQR